MGEGSGMATHDLTSAALAERWLASWNSNDLVAVMKCYAEEATVIGPGLTRHSKTEVTAFFRDHFPWDAGFQLAEASFIASGDKVAVQYLGPVSKLPHVSVLTVRDGLIVKQDIYSKGRPK